MPAPAPFSAPRTTPRSLAARIPAPTRLLALCGALLLAACQSAPEAPESESRPPAQRSAPAAGASAAAKSRLAPRSTAAKAPQPAPAGKPAEPVDVTDETIQVAPGATGLSPAMEARLDPIVQQVKANSQLRIRLEAYSPERGSNALEIAMAEQSLQLVRSRLIALGIRPFRIETTIRGDQAGAERARERNGVRLYIIEPTLN